MTPELERAARALRRRCALPEEMPVGLAEELAGAVLRSVLSDPSEAMVEAVGKALKHAFAEPVIRWHEASSLPPPRYPEWEKDSHIWIKQARAALRAAAAHVLGEG